MGHGKSPDKETQAAPKKEAATKGATRVGAWRVGQSLRAAVAKLGEAEAGARAAGATAFAWELSGAACQLEAAAERVEIACDRQLGRERGGEPSAASAAVFAYLAGIVVRHDPETGPCSRCGDACGPGVIGASDGGRLCGACVLATENRLGMLLMLGALARIFRPDSVRTSLAEPDRAYMRGVITRIYDHSEQRFPEAPDADWFRDDDGAGRIYAAAPGDAAKLREVGLGHRPARFLRLVGADDAAEAEVEAAEPGDPSEGVPLVAALVASGEPIPAPDVLALALLVEAVDDSTYTDEWAQLAATQALAWLIAGSPTAAGHVLGLLAEVETLEMGALLAAAKGRA